MKTAIVLSAALGLVVSTAGVCRADVVRVGAGSYTDDLADFDPAPADVAVPTGPYPAITTADHGPTFTPHVTAEAPFPYPTSDWWTSVLTETYSRNLFAIPMAFRCEKRGLLVDRPGLLVAKDAVYTPFKPDLRIGLQDVTHDEALAAGWGDFTVDILFPDPQAGWTATMGHGLPFVYAAFTGGVPEVTFLSRPEVVRETPDGLLIRVDDDVFYGVFFVGGAAEMHATGPQTALRLPGCTYLAVAALPDAASFEAFRPAAFQRVTDSRVDYRYDVQAGEVTTTYRVDTVPVKGDPEPTYLALFPHHYKGQDLELTSAGYDSIRGRLKLVHADRFTTVVPFHGMMPFFPEPTSASYEPQRLRALLEKVVAADDFFTHGETYFEGKQLALIARLIPIADTAGHDDIKDRLLSELRRALVDWFTATPGEKHHYFYYDPTCGGLIGMNASFFAYNYTDHHFHYAHFVYAAAIVALYDPGFKDDYGPMVELLIHDYNSPDRDHPLFPHQRMMDPYEGHSWANGTGGWGEGLDDAGNDQESSSEAVHAWQAIFMWGMVTGNDRLRDHGAWGYVTEAAATDQYYFDVDNDIYPNGAAFAHELVSILLGGKATYVGYSDFSEYTYGIQYLPITPSSLYLGYSADHARRQYANFVKENDGPEDRWFDVMWMYQALFDPDAALAKFDESVKIDRDGSSFANIYRWIHFLVGAGRVDVSVAAPWPYVSAFRKGDRITVLAYNPGPEPVEVPFAVRATGAPLATLTVAPGAVATGTVAAP